LVNSNPATIMTDPEFADRTYIEPITPEVIEAILEREKPDAILPTLGGQTALNAAMELSRNGALARHGVKLIGANAQAIAKVGSIVARRRVANSRTGDIRRIEDARASPCRPIDEANDTAVPAQDLSQARAFGLRRAHCCVKFLDRIE